MSWNQLRSIGRLYRRSADGAISLRSFAGRFRQDPVMCCVMGTWCGMLVGIEPDGYTHT